VIFEDERGSIEDILSRIDAVTLIKTRKGSIRGNHIHYQTDQWTYVVKGRLLMAQADREPVQVGSGYLLAEPRGIPHAWKALEDSECLVFTRGPRGDDYESDTYRLNEPLIS
jgi:quercetin dioxygenase-like cupin family protein